MCMYVFMYVCIHLVIMSLVVIQGCPWSVIVFEQGIDKWLRWIEHPYQATGLPVPVQGYVDDVSASGTSQPQIAEATRKTDEFMTAMELKHRKCGVLHGKRSGNNWPKKDKTGETKLTIQGVSLPMLNRDQSYTYLGYDINMSNTASQRQAEGIVRDFKLMLNKIDASPLPVTAKLQAVSIMCCSKLNFYFANLTFSVQSLKVLEDAVVKCARSWLQLNDSSTRSFMFTPRSEGGLGLSNPQAIYHAKHISFRLSVLNSEDAQVRETARSSLSLQMRKRKVREASPADENSFAGYQRTDEGILRKDSRVNWPRSDWVHLNDLCVRENVLLRKRPVDDNYELKFTVDEVVQLTTADSRAAFSLIKQSNFARFTAAWKQKESQGRVVREATSADHRLSMAFLSNVNLNESVIRLIVRGRLQLLQCNSLLALCYSTQYSKQCPLCNHPSETASHVLNGCTRYQKLYQERHNRIVDLIYQNMESFETSAVRPDITVIDRENHEVTLVEVAVPFDSHIDSCFSGKFQKYMPLCLQINDLGYYCKIIVIIVGSLGTVHKKVVPGLRLLGLPRQSTKWLAKYLSVSAALGSFRTWQRRCRDLEV
eukprot:TRINITY_DN38897_c0_g1_i6.p1 TRINITY_DN38897_c0_g1~~TRINITY_DN38897_c0_g1_i6.p1  ORF type:complete len:597 (-),score=89.74 TRINITY_DN38897_c0_g1_i6:48-1838(-)